MHLQINLLTRSQRVLSADRLLRQKEELARQGQVRADIPRESRREMPFLNPGRQDVEQDLGVRYRRLSVTDASA